MIAPVAQLPTRREPSRRVAVNRALVVGVILGTLLGASVYGGLVWLSDTAYRIAERTQGDHGGLPQCTDEIADAGGMCWGEPLTVIPSAAHKRLPTIRLVPCAREDSQNCYWDAARMGNGLGRSFVNLGGVLYYAAP